MGIDTLETMMQYDLRLNNELYESVTTLLYKPSPSVSLAMILPPHFRL
jgi:hypothetical protein